jgi:hypothetical protein
MENGFVTSSEPATSSPRTILGDPRPPCAYSTTTWCPGLNYLEMVVERAVHCHLCLCHAVWRITKVRVHQVDLAERGTSKCRVFAWLAALGKCNTADCLEKKRIPHNAACVLCLSHPETALHLLANCNVAIRVWHKVLRSANLPVSLAPAATTLKLQEWIADKNRLHPKVQRKAWISLIYLTWWNILKERNTRIF